MIITVITKNIFILLKTVFASFLHVPTIWLFSGMLILHVKK